MTEEPKIGTPRKTISEWLEVFARDNEEEASRRLSPWGRAKFKGRASAYRDASRMIRRAYAGDTMFPITLDPGQSVEFRIPLSPPKSDLPNPAT